MIVMVIVIILDLIIVDELIILLDVMVQQEILRLLIEFKKEFGIGIFFIFYDLGVILEIVD